MSNPPLLEVKGLTKTFKSRGKKEVQTAVDHVSFSIEKGTSFGLIGESGSGKTTIGRMILHLIEPDEGTILYDGLELSKKYMHPFRRKIQIIFQNPQGSLDPNFTIYDSVAEGIRSNHLAKTQEEEREKVLSLLNRVGLSETDAEKYPHEFSGGQLQRVVIARALAVDPDLVICDEPVSALDVSYQAQIINLLMDLQEERNITYLFISHDLSVVMAFCDRIGVLYHGKLVEIGTAEEIALRPQHEYTKALLQAIPIPDPEKAHL